MPIDPGPYVCSTDTVLERRANLTLKEIQIYMVLLFSQAVILDSSKAMSDLVSALLMCDASSSERDSDIRWELLCPSGSIDSAQL